MVVKCLFIHQRLAHATVENPLVDVVCYPCYLCDHRRMNCVKIKGPKRKLSNQRVL